MLDDDDLLPLSAGAPPRRRVPKKAARVSAEASVGAAAQWAEIVACAQRPNAIDLAHGFPDYAGSPMGAAGAIEALARGDTGQSSLIPGSQRVRAALSAYYHKCCPRFPRSADGGARPLDVDKEICTCAGLSLVTHDSKC